MPNTQVITNRDQPLGELLRQRLQGAIEFRAATAFLNSGGLALVLPDFERTLLNEGSVHLMHGPDFRIVDPDAVETLTDLRARFGNFHYYVHTEKRFHPKVYIIDSEDFATAVVGSSNMTHAGLSSNDEVNAVLTGRRMAKGIRECHKFFTSFVENPASIEPNSEFARAFRRFHQDYRKLPTQDDLPIEWEKLLQEYRIDEATVKEVAWTPRNQTEIVIRAMQILESKEQPSPAPPSGRTWDLDRIIGIAETVARTVNEEYKWDTFHNSIRRSINSHYRDSAGTTVGRGYFLRMPGNRGEYRLTESGRNYRGGDS